MSAILRNVISVFAGLIVGSLVNSSMVAAGANWFELPEGVDPKNLESIKANLHLYEAKHFINPLLAHSFGSLAGGIVAALIAASHKMKFALAVGAVFLVGGIMMISIIGGPIWFILVDLMLAYIPMAYLGAVIGGANKTK
jgi:hypothetical protein